MYEFKKIIIIFLIGPSIKGKAKSYFTPYVTEIVIEVEKIIFQNQNKNDSVFILFGEENNCGNFNIYNGSRIKFVPI
jgi:hypothetical protein